MPSDLTPAEKEEHQVERLIDKKPPPSRKTDDKRGPKHDNRRRRMHVEDSDIDAKDSDMSLASIAFSIAASYGAESVKAMAQKTASYHGVLQQGHPSGPTNTVYKSYDKRYFGKEHFDAIVAAAKDLMGEDWLKHGWDGGSPDAPVRAALDMAIHLADANLYQSKIDSETYDMLLNRLAGWKHDQFAETIFPKDGSTRSASVMKDMQNFLRIASELRHSNPRAALDIVKAVKSIRVAEEQEQQEQQAQVPPQLQAQQGQQDQAQQEQCHQIQHGQEQQGQQEQAQQEQQGLSDKEMSSFVEGNLDVKGLKEKTKKLMDAPDVEGFIDGLKDLSEDLKKTTSSSRVATMGGANLESILDALDSMSEEEGKSFMKTLTGQADALNKSLDSDDIDGFVKGLDAMFSDVEEAAKHVKTSSVLVSLSTLVRLASASPKARAVLLPILAADKKKKDKKKAKKKKAPKKAPKKDGKKAPPFGGNKAPPFGGNKAPPFGGKKKAPPFAKKKASVAVLTTDAEW